MLVLDHGRIAQLGTPAELSTQDGLYKQIENIQSMNIHKADSSESPIRVTDPPLQESIAASKSEAGMVNDDHEEVNV